MFKVLVLSCCINTGARALQRVAADFGGSELSMVVYKLAGWSDKISTASVTSDSPFMFD